LENLNGRDHLEDLGVDGNIIDPREIGWEGEDWIHVAQDMDTVMNLWIS
jgi:hypothetical protein